MIYRPGKKDLVKKVKARPTNLKRIILPAPKAKKSSDVPIIKKSNAYRRANGFR
jgi:hypothetical protein